MTRSNGATIENHLKHNKVRASDGLPDYLRNAKRHIKQNRGRRPSPDVVRTQKRLNWITSRRKVI